jgi:hypothetical protein
VGNRLEIGQMGEAIALHLVNYAPDEMNVKQLKELCGVMCSAASEYCANNKIENDVYGV